MSKAPPSYCVLPKGNTGLEAPIGVKVLLKDKEGRWYGEGKG